MACSDQATAQDIPRSFTLAGGLQTIAGILADGLSVRFDQTVRDIRRTDDGFIVTAADGGKYHSRSLCLATVADAARLLQPAFPGIGRHSSRFKLRQMESVGVAVPKAQLKLPLVAGLIGRNEAFYSAVSRDTTS